jgi:hypothetical protein
MLATEWNFDDAVQVAREEGWKKGREEDRKLVFDIIRQVNSMDDLKKCLKCRFLDKGGYRLCLLCFQQTPLHPCSSVISCDKACD